MSTAPAQVELESTTPAPQAVAPRRRRSHFLILLVVAVVCLAGFLLWVSHNRQKDLAEGSKLRTATASRGDFVRSIRISGTVEAIRSHVITAPTLSGQTFGTMTVTRMARPGSAVKKGDLLVEFDRQNQIKSARDKEAEYRDLVEQIKKKQAEQAAARAKDETELKQAEDAVSSAELEVSRNEVVSRIDAEKNLATLEEARARLKQLRTTFELKRKAAQAEIRILEIQRDRARQDMRHSQMNAEKMAVHSPIDGVVVLSSTWKGGSMGEVQEGDDVRSGVPFMQVMNPGSMQVRARVNQADIAYLQTGQPARIYLDAYPTVVLKGRLQSLSGIGIASTQSVKVRTYTALFSIEDSHPSLMPDLTAAVDVELERLPNALTVPRDALISDRNGAYVYVRDGTGWKKQTVQTGATNEYESVIISGLNAGDAVQRNPEAGTRGTE